eukprot:scaffold53887_cov57-Phaeocystis_antarctica.AAC.8
MSPGRNHRSPCCDPSRSKLRHLPFHAAQAAAVRLQAAMHRSPGCSLAVLPTLPPSRAHAAALP